jgi:hypothetical protein
MSRATYCPRATFRSGLIWNFKVFCFLQIFPPNFALSTSLFSRRSKCIACLILFVLILLILGYLTEKWNHTALVYAVFFSLLLHPPSKFEILSLTPFCKTRSLCVLLLTYETKFCTIIEWGAELISFLCVLHFRFLGSRRESERERERPWMEEISHAFNPPLILSWTLFWLLRLVCKYNIYLWNMFKDLISLIKCRFCLSLPRSIVRLTYCESESVKWRNPVFLPPVLRRAIIRGDCGQRNDKKIRIIGI